MNGWELEQIFKKTLEQEYKDSATVRFQNMTGTEEDIKEGTDYIIKKFKQEYRLDPTLDFHHKETHGNTELIGTNTILDGDCFVEIQYGYKTHNGHHALKQPVLVIGVNDRNGMLERGGLKATRDFEQNIAKIVNIGIDRFNEKELIPQIKDNPFLIEELPMSGKHSMQTPKMQEIAIKSATKEDVEELAWSLARPNTAIKKMLVEKNGLAIESIDSPSEEIQLLAVLENPRAIYKIKNPTDAVLLEVRNQSKEIFLEYMAEWEKDIAPTSQVSMVEQLKRAKKIIDITKNRESDILQDSDLLR